MADSLIRALVAVEGLDAFDVQRAMPDDPNFELVGMTDGVDDTVRMLQTRQVDVLLVACQGREDDKSLQIIDVPELSARCTGVISIGGSTTLRFSFAIAGSFQFVILPRKMPDSISDVNFTSDCTPGTL